MSQDASTAVAVTMDAPSLRMLDSSPAAYCTSVASGDLQLPLAKRRRQTIPAGSSRSTSERPNSGILAKPQAKRHRGLGKEDRHSHIQPMSVLSEGPLCVISSCLGPRELTAMDATCRFICALNATNAGPWCDVGRRAFLGMEVDVPGGFVSFDADSPMPPLRPGKSGTRSAWKHRYQFFHTGAPSFSMPFTGAEITSVENSDEVAYCRCRLRTDQLLMRPELGIYVEVEVRANADNLSLAVVDFENDRGQSSVTFSPETGAVLRERKMEPPRAIEGKYIHLLPPSPGRRFEGTMGLFLRDGHLAFFRRWGPLSATSDIDKTLASDTKAEWGQWETTGFCMDLRWAQGPRLSLCLPFRDAGEYHVRISKVDRNPPIPTTRRAEAYQDERWSLLFGDDDHAIAI